jgi:hypothetical protein
MMASIASQLAHWLLIAALMFGFIATAGHLMGLIIVTRSWNIGGVVGVAVLGQLSVSSSYFSLKPEYYRP